MSDRNIIRYGQCKGNVANTFGECDPAGAVLFLNQANVAPMPHTARGLCGYGRALRWLVLCKGTFVCVTHHPDAFDAAMARRFVFRLHFRPLLCNQRLALSPN